MPGLGQSAYGTEGYRFESCRVCYCKLMVRHNLRCQIGSGWTPVTHGIPWARPRNRRLGNHVMGRKPAWPPRIYPRRGKDYVRLYLAPGEPVELCLGPSGSDLAKSEYARILAEAGTRAGHTHRVPRTQAVKVAELVKAYIDQLGQHPRQQWRIRKAFEPVIQLYAHTPADRFGPIALDACRRTLVEKGYCRRLVNQMTDCVRWGFRWAASKELVPAAQVDALYQLIPLRERDFPRSDPPAIEPVPEDLVRHTLRVLPATLRDMVEVQLLTGMRPGEVCSLRGGEINRAWLVAEGVPIWLYEMGSHKNEWRGLKRWIPLGPRAQRVLQPYLDRRGPMAPVFSAAEALVEKALALGRKPRPRTGLRAVRDHFDTQSYGKRILEICDAFLIPRWAPNQIRHRAGTDVETAFGREDARCFLGHSSPSTTAIYAEQVERAARVAARIG